MKWLRQALSKKWAIHYSAAPHGYMGVVGTYRRRKTAEEMARFGERLAWRQDTPEPARGAGAVNAAQYAALRARWS